MIELPNVLLSNFSRRGSTPAKGWKLVVCAARYIVKLFKV